MHILFSLSLLRFPEKSAKTVVSARKRRQQTGLKAYIDAGESRLGPKIAIFESKLGCFSKIFFFLQGEWDLKNEQKEDKNYHFFESKLGPTMLRNIIGPIFDSTLDQVLTQPFWQFRAIFLLENMLKPLFLWCSQQKSAFFKPTPKNMNTICEHNCANWFFSWPFFSAFLLLVFCCVRFFGFAYWRGMKNKNKNKKKTRKEEGPQDANKKTT